MKELFNNTDSHSKNFIQGKYKITFLKRVLTRSLYCMGTRFSKPKKQLEIKNLKCNCYSRAILSYTNNVNVIDIFTYITSYCGNPIKIIRYTFFEKKNYCIIALLQ